MEEYNRLDWQEVAATTLSDEEKHLQHASFCTANFLGFRFIELRVAVIP